MSAIIAQTPAAAGSESAPAGTVPRWCWAVMITLAIAKLVLVSHDEVLTFSDDDAGYAYSASMWHWGAHYATFSHVRQPVYHLFLALSGVFGLPERLWIELTWMGACCVMTVALRRLGMSVLASMAAYALVLYHPWTITLFNRFLSDTLYAPLMLVFVCALGAGLTRTRWPSMARWGLLTGAAAALAANTRPEAVLLTGTLAVGAACVLALWALKHADRRTTLHRMIWTLLVPVVMVQGLTHALCAVNQSYIGAYVTQDLELPGFRRLYRQLLSITPAHPDLRLSIPRDVRDWAYQHSPTFATLGPLLETDERVLIYALPVQTATGVKGEYGAWSVWAFRVAAWRHHHWESAGALDDFYSSAADELRAALRNDRAVARWAPFDFVPPEWGLLARQLPVSLGRCWMTLASANFRRGIDLEVTPQARANFDSVGVRRAPLIELNAKGAPSHTEGSAWRSPSIVGRMDSVKRGIAALQGPLVHGGAVVVVVGTLIGLIGIRSRLLHARWYVLSALLITAIVARVLLTAMLDVTGISVQKRYLLPIAPLFTILVVLNTQTVVYGACVVAKRLRAGPGAKAGGR